MCAKVSRRLQDSHLRCTLGTSPVHAAAWQRVRQDGLVFVFDCLPGNKLEIGNKGEAWLQRQNDGRH